MFDGCQKYWHINIAAVRCSFTCTDNFRGGQRQCVYLVVKVGVAGEATTQTGRPMKRLRCGHTLSCGPACAG